MTTIKTLPEMESTFSIEIKGSKTGQVFQGTFTYRTPNIRNSLEISKSQARLNEGIKNLDEDALLLNNVLASLKHTLISAPDWWKSSNNGMDLYDINVIFEVYKYCIDFEELRQNKLFGADESKTS